MRIVTKALCTGALILSGTAAVPVAAQGPVSTIRACVGPSGAVRVLVAEPDCKANEWPITLPSAVEPPPPPPPTPTGGLRVVNAEGTDIGPLLDAAVAVLTLPNGNKAAAELYRANAPANWGLTVYYLQPGCAGEGFVSWGTAEELLPAALVRRAGVWALRPGSLAKRPFTSFHIVGDNGPGTCQGFLGTLDSFAFDFYAPAALGIIYPLSVQ